MKTETASLVIHLAILVLTKGPGSNGIQCYHCQDRLPHDPIPNTLSTVIKHHNTCGTRKMLRKYDCKESNLCFKQILHYTNNSKVIEVKRSCWESTGHDTGRNYSDGGCYSDYLMSKPYKVVICICAGNYCNSQSIMSISYTTSIILIGTVFIHTALNF